MYHDNTNQLTNIDNQDLHQMVDSIVILKQNKIKKKFIINLSPVNIVVRIIPQHQISAGSPRYGVLVWT